MTDDPRERFAGALKRGLRCGPVRRRRVVREITAHLDDTVTELKADGMTEAAAVQEALRRVGDVGTITSAFRQVRPRRRRWPRFRGLRSPAWVAVGAMSLVTALAAELPQASGAKAPPVRHSTIELRHVVRSSDRQHRGAARRLIRAPRPDRR